MVANNGLARRPEPVEVEELNKGSASFSSCLDWTRAQTSARFANPRPPDPPVAASNDMLGRPRAGGGSNRCGSRGRERQKVQFVGRAARVELSRSAGGGESKRARSGQVALGRATIGCGCPRVETPTREEPEPERNGPVSRRPADGLRPLMQIRPPAGGRPERHAPRAIDQADRPATCWTRLVPLGSARPAMQATGGWRASGLSSSRGPSKSWRLKKSI